MQGGQGKESALKQSAAERRHRGISRCQNGAKTVQVSAQQGAVEKQRQEQGLKGS